MSAARGYVYGLAIFCLSAGLHSLSGSGSFPSLLLLLLLLVLLLVHVPSVDLPTRTFSTPFPLAGGLLLSYLLALLPASNISIAEKLAVLAPAAVLVAALPVYAVVLLSHGLVAAKGGMAAQLLVFPLLWASGWATYCSLHPLGRLLAWTPVDAMQGFGGAVLPLLGLPGYDFLVGCMATGIVAAWQMLSPAADAGETQLAEQDLLIDNGQQEVDERSPLLPSAHRQKERSTQRSKIPLALLAAFLLALWAASSAIQTYSLPPSSGSDSIKVGCVLPLTSAGEHRPTLRQYIDESEVVSGRGAKLLLWPEAVAHFSSRSEYAVFDAQLRSLAQRRRAFLAPSFSAQAHYLTDRLPEHYPAKDVIASTLISPAGELEYAYFKQALVPIAESYAYERGSAPLPRKQIFIPRAGARFPAQGTNVSVSTAICHDTSFPSIMRQAYPSSLVLVPSSVFSPSLAATRIAQLQASAQALGTAYLVCDASPRGVSAFIDQDGRMKHFQIGPGSFEVLASLDQGRRTPYGKYGEAGALGILLGFVLACIALEAALRAGRDALRRAGNQALDALRARVYLWTGWSFFRRPEYDFHQTQEQQDLLSDD